MFHKGNLYVQSPREKKDPLVENEKLTLATELCGDYLWGEEEHEGEAGAFAGTQQEGQFTV